MKARLLGTSPLEYRGHCKQCGREHRFANDASLAVEALADLFDSLQHDPAMAAERSALAESPGKMLGVLVFDGGALRAYSGELEGRAWDGWVGPVLKRSDTGELETVTLARIRELDLLMAGCDVVSAQRTFDEARGRVVKEAAKAQLLAVRETLSNYRKARRETSRVLSAAMFGAAAVTNARGERKPLRDVFVGEGIAGGTTDCCVPKLLEAANVRGLRPIGLAEAWWGQSLNGRHHGELQAPCEKKCQPVLGHLLCGLEENISAGVARSPAAAR